MSIHQIKGLMEHLQLDLFSVSTSKEIKNLRRWVSRLEKRISEMELRQELIQHAKKTGFRFAESNQLRLFESAS